MTYVTKSQFPRVSIVLPVYNEAERIAACLWAIARQTVAPYEVIVVDNGSTDSTAAIADSFPFVRVICETRKGVVHARDAGFNAASGDTIGRIDADSRIAPNWVETLARTFAVEPDTQAISGSLHYYDVACPRLVDTVDEHIRAWLGKRTAGAVYLLGANMAIRRSAWQRVRPTTCSHSGMHEDLDLAAHLSMGEQHVRYVPELVSGVSGRCVDTGFIDFARYLLSMPSTYRAHRLWQRVHFYPVMLFVAACYLLLRAGYRGYNDASGRFSWRQIFTLESSERTNPIY